MVFPDVLGVDDVKPYGIDYSKVLGFGLVDKPVSELTPDDRALIQLNISEQKVFGNLL